MLVPFSVQLPRPDTIQPLPSIVVLSPSAITNTRRSCCNRVRVMWRRRRWHLRRPLSADTAAAIMVVLENPTSDPLATGVGLVQDPAATTPLTVDTTGAVAPQHHQMAGSGGGLSATYPIPTTAAATGQRHQLKMVPKRFINMHQWFNPIGVKQIKEAMVRAPFPRSVVPTTAGADHKLFYFSSHPLNMIAERDLRRPTGFP